MQMPPSSSSEAPLSGRRPLSSRNTRWARAIARGLARAGVNPNVISAASLVFAAIGAWALAELGTADAPARPWLALVAAVGIQLRLAANLFDGLVAVEHQRKQATGDLWNEVPDRFADVALLVAAGYGVASGARWCGESLGPLFGWSAAVLAVATAYVRQLGGALGFTQDFRGPMAKQQRMFVLSLGALAAPLLLPAVATSGVGGGSAAAGAVCAGWRELPAAIVAGGPVAIALVVIVVGAAITFARRLHGISRALRARAATSPGVAPVPR